ncbi:MAG: prepilin-type N-terminal cleavage/methylation domain-containing protein, partial [Alphaproteobacteria bacterium]
GGTRGRVSARGEGCRSGRITADPSPERRGARGFTLVEILVAFAILTLTLTAVMQGLSGGLRILSVSHAQAQALRIAENRLAEAGRAYALTPGTETGAQGRYQWRVEITPHDDGAIGAPPSLPSAYRVTATVRWGGGRRLSLSTIELGAPGYE